VDDVVYYVALVVVFILGMIVGTCAIGPDLATKQRACWGDVARFNGDTLKAVKTYPECLKIIYPERPQ
jgi:hypothetical protein